MFLNKLTLNLRNPRARHDLANPYEMHRSLMNAYARARVENRCDVLFRIEPSLNGPPVVLVQTREVTDWTRLPAGYLLEQAERTPLDLPVSVGQRLRFRLRANPTKRVAEKNERLGGVMADKRIGINTESELRKGDASGFSVPGEWLELESAQSGVPIGFPNFRVDVIPEGRNPNGKPGHNGKFLAVRFDGLLVVQNPERFRECVGGGIGSGKAFGFGLLSVAPANG